MLTTTTTTLACTNSGTIQYTTTTYYGAPACCSVPVNGKTIQCTSQTQTSGSSPFPDNGYIQIGSIGYFHYMKIQGSGGEPTLSTRLENVAFTYLKPNATTTGGICCDFRVTFQDASTENPKACSFPTNFETSLTFSKHAKPTAGLMLISGASIYAMISM